jgi:hypothetical protein
MSAKTTLLKLVTWKASSFIVPQISLSFHYQGFFNFFLSIIGLVPPKVLNIAKASPSAPRPNWVLLVDKRAGLGWGHSMRTHAPSRGVGGRGKGWHFLTLGFIGLHLSDWNPSNLIHVSVRIGWGATRKLCNSPRKAVHIIIFGDSHERVLRGLPCFFWRELVGARSHCRSHAPSVSHSHSSVVLFLSLCRRLSLPRNGGFVFVLLIIWYFSSPI